MSRGARARGTRLLLVMPDRVKMLCVYCQSLCCVKCPLDPCGATPIGLAMSIQHTGIVDMLHMNLRRAYLPGLYQKYTR